LKVDLSSLRKKVAVEAATLLYSGVEKEYKQAKLKAASICGCHFLPTNAEVATELDRVAEENEGQAREERLTQMRKEALHLMKLLSGYKPLLVGSVWRGTAHRKSDIDLVIYHDDAGDVIKALKQSSLRIAQAEWVNITKRGQNRTSFHIYVESPAGYAVEIVVRAFQERMKREKCEIYGDEIKGLGVRELEKLLRENPTQLFTPP
jgi:predicted nucleotidyltransferase